LGQSLLRLHRSLEQSQEQEQHVDSQFATWQENWLSRRDQITSRLAIIESQLQQLAGKNDTRPRLSVVGVPDDADEMTGMGVC
jgi:hypothetical protein